VVLFVIIVDMKKQTPVIMQAHIGDTFGRLTIFDGPFYETRVGKKSSAALWECVCVCGKMKRVFHSNLIGGKSLSCGCLCSERTREALTTHGEASISTRTSEWSIWSGMKDRCCNLNEAHYKDYGGRGIVVCERWMHSYQNFLADMGRRPTSRHTLEREDVNGPYSPDNCTWATYKQQARNRRSNVEITFNGETLCIAEWAEKLGIKEQLIRGRIRYGWSVERALTESSGLRPLVSHNEKEYLLMRKRHLERELSRINELLDRKYPLQLSVA
jgi:hypothetical protein